MNQHVDYKPILSICAFESGCELTAIAAVTQGDVN